ncbi:hypothetical protein [Xanthocytophaga agilis]|uniref:Uncharacterized protein n=1 Tax=Xanthocytophaga agilis TaxID=3048010 RepID=A0AAE3UJS2_9BACT|nr:hypothetical protein [Xanthocytophaga agilis]MDJ1505623.1 hypothetical protein [Xanthocytophaga agilis]
MATYFNTIIIRSQPFADASSVLKALNPASWPVDYTTQRICEQGIEYNSAINEHGISIGFWKGFTILCGDYIIHSLHESLGEGHFSAKTRSKWESWFPNADMLLVFGNDTAMDFMIVKIHAGKVIRHKHVRRSKIVTDKGDLLPEEQDCYDTSIPDLDIRTLKEYKQGIADTNVGLGLIESFCGEMPDLDNFRMNIGINEGFGISQIQTINESMGAKEECLEMIINRINQPFSDLKLKIRKHKDIAKEEGYLSFWKQPGVILRKINNLHIILVPVILCSYAVRIEIKLKIQVADPLVQEQFSYTSGEFSCMCYQSSELKTRAELDEAISQMDAVLSQICRPVFESTAENVFEVLGQKFVTVEYITHLIKQIEQIRIRLGFPVPSAVRFKTIQDIVQLGKATNSPYLTQLKQEVYTYLLSYREKIDLPDNKYLTPDSYKALLAEFSE